MPFGTIVAQSLNYDPRSEGIYSLRSVEFGQPANEFRIRGGSVGKDGQVRMSWTRYVQQAVILGGNTELVPTIVTLNYTVPRVGGLTPSQLDGLVLDLSEFCTASTISRGLQGEA